MIDHHPQREGLPLSGRCVPKKSAPPPPCWSRRCASTMARSPLLQATLLLLGIYEDTGSLTYTRTTARDLRAAASLLEQGAACALPPTSSTTRSRQPAGALRTTARQRRALPYPRIYHRAGDGDAQEIDEELSTIAHKLRDLLDPDAFVRAGDHARRSAVDRPLHQRSHRRGGGSGAASAAAGTNAPPPA